jgi:hypothetical protein
MVIKRTITRATATPGAAKDNPPEIHAKFLWSKSDQGTWIPLLTMNYNQCLLKSCGPIGAQSRKMT